MNVRGFLAGGVWGVVVGGVAVAAASLVNPPPKLQQTSETDEAVPENTREIDSTVSVDAGEGPSIEAPVGTASAPETPESEAPVATDDAPETVAAPASEAAPVVDTGLAEVPVQTEAAEDAAPVPEDTADVVETLSDETVAEEAVPEEAGTDDAAEETAAVEPGLSDVAPVAAAEDLPVPNAPDEGTAPETVAATDAAPDASDAPAVVAAGDTAPDAPEGTQTTTAGAPQVAGAATLDTPTPATESAAQITADAAPAVSAAEPDVPAVPETDAVADGQTTPIEEPSVAAVAPQADEAPAEGADAPDLVAVTDPTPLTPTSPVSPGDPASSDAAPGDEGVTNTAPVVSVLPSGDSGVRVNRLTGDSDEVAVNEPETEGAEIAPLPDDAPAVLRYGAVAENPDDLPELSVVLADDGSFDGAVAAIVGLPFPVSVMLNPSAAGAADRMAAYRAAGVEVGMLVSLPPAATASDVAIYFEAAMTGLPEAFAILDATGDTQGDADVIRQTISVLAEDGQGLITVPRGLNTAPRVAAEAGVAAGVIFRDIDGESQDARTIQRFMDQAAFRAGQTPGVMLLGRVQGETISALSQWGTQSSRAAQVAVVPASAVLTAE